MSTWNSVLRLGLELGALGSMGYWGSRQGDGWMSYALAIGIPLAAAVAWGTFAVPDDPSRSGGAPVPVPGAVRLALEFTVFGLGAWTLHKSGHTTSALTFGGLVLFHNAVYYDRVIWLLGTK
jgi:hypothetical protein